MALLKSRDRKFALCVDELIRVNPFVPERIEMEKQTLQEDYIPQAAAWNLDPLATEALHNTQHIVKRASLLLESVGQRLKTASCDFTDEDMRLCRSLVFFQAYHRYLPLFTTAIRDRMKGSRDLRSFSFYEDFKQDVDTYLSSGVLRLEPPYNHAHLFALGFQVARAFTTIFYFIVGMSAPTALLRARVWESIFTQDLLEHSRLMYQHMGDITTLIAGPSGTGKELVARAIGLSRYIPFDLRTKSFEEDFLQSFYALNLSAFSPSLIESELFGHKKGAFTGALNDRIGWLEQCGPWGTVFLDEIGDIDPAIQIKLLRVLESRKFERLGDNKSSSFNGKVIAATNRSLSAEMDAGRFREDLYYRLCADLIETPSLHARIKDVPEELPILVSYLLKRWLGEDVNPEIGNRCTNWIWENLGANYEWPGNVRELDRCILNIVMHGTYAPHKTGAGLDSVSTIVEGLRTGNLTAEDLLSKYCTLTYLACGTYEGTGQKLGLDRRTVKRYVEKNVKENHL